MSADRVLHCVAESEEAMHEWIRGKFCYEPVIVCYLYLLVLLQHCNPMEKAKRKVLEEQQ